MTTLPNNCVSGHCKAIEEHSERTAGREIWRKKCGLRVEVEKDKGGSTRQSWMETSGLWLVFSCLRN